MSQKESAQAAARYEMSCWMRKAKLEGGDPRLGWNPKGWKEAGLSLGETDKYGWTLAHWATHFEWREGLQELRDLGAPMDQADEWGRAPLMVAVGRVSEEMVEELLRAGADARKKSQQGKSALWMAVAEEENGNPRRLALIQRLIGAGADLSETDKSGRGLLHLAAWKASVGRAELLLQAGADPESKERSGLNFWEWARSLESSSGMEIRGAPLERRQEFAKWAEGVRESRRQKKELEEVTGLNGVGVKDRASHRM